MKVKPFYILITDDMTPQMVQDAFDKCVDAGAVACEGVEFADKKHKYQDAYDIRFNCFGVDVDSATMLYDNNENYGIDAQEITLDQLDEWLGLEVEQEWKLGDKCVLAGNEYTFGCVNPICDQGSVVIFDETGDYHGCCVSELSKPETHEQKAERERLEAAYDLYVTGNEYCNFPSAKSFDEFKNDGFQNDFWLTIVDKTGYRKAK